MSIVGFAAMIFAGATLGLIGAGGSILTLPILVYFFSIPPDQATGLSLAVVGVTSGIALITHWQQGTVDWRLAAKYIPASFAGVLIARTMILPAIPDRILASVLGTISKGQLIMGVFAVVMILAARAMISSPKAAEVRSLKSSRFSILIVGLLTGVLTGFVGAGGGFMIIPALISLLDVPLSKAIGTSLAVIAIQSTGGFLAEAFQTINVPWTLLAALIIAASVPAVIGAKLSHKLPPNNLKKGFGWFTLAMGSFILIKQIL
jgi:uncharacterized membrane protein YfcA